MSLILISCLLSPSLANSAFGQLKAQKELIPEFNVSFNLPGDIIYDSSVADTSKFSKDNFFDSLKQTLTDECKSLKNDKDYFTCDNLQFDNQKIIQSTVNFYYVESSQKISYKTNFATDSKQTTTWIMVADLGNGIVRFYPKYYWGINGTLVSTGTGKGIYGSAYWEKLIVLEKPDPTPITDSFKSIVQEKTFIKKIMPINIFIVGDDVSSEKILKLKSKLPTSTTPVLLGNLQSIGIEYLYDYNIVAVDDKISDNLKEIIKTKSEKSDLMHRVLDEVSVDHLWFNSTHPDWIVKKPNWPTELKYDYKLVDAKIIEDFLFSNLIEKKYEGEVNLVFLDYDLSEIGFLRNYKVTSSDQSTGKEFQATGLMGYGSEKNLYFIDLYSVPWKQSQLNENSEYGLPTLSGDFKTLHDCTECFEEVVSEYSTNFLNHLVNSFVTYDPGVHSKINVEILIYQRTGGTQSVSESTLPKLVNIDVLKKELSELYPYADWTFDVTLANKQSHGIHQEFIQELDSPNFIRDQVSHEIVVGTEKYQFISGENFRHIMKWWAEQVTPKDQVGTTTKTIPVLLILYNGDYELYIDQIGELGTAYPDDTNPLESCCIFAVENENDFWNEKQGVTDLLLHEIGHVMGLNHPFDYVDKDTYASNNFWNFYSSPMTYAFPGHPSACAGFFNNIWAEREVRTESYGFTKEIQKIDLLEKPCGITGTKFTTLEKNRVFDAMVGLQLRSASQNLQIYKADSNEDDMAKITQIESLISLSAQEFMNTNRNQLSLQHAVEANEKSVALFSPTETQPENISPKNQIVIPVWIKNNAKWWAHGTISDDDFVNGIQFMIKEGIITIPNASPQDSASTQIPDWIKNNAKWWSENQISDGDFVKGIQYLVKVGIIKIK